MCAIDALGIPAMLDTDAVITSRDPETGEPITVQVTGGGTDWRPANAVVHLGSRADCRTTTSAESCCGYINFFGHRRGALTWAARHPEIDSLVLDQDQALAEDVRCFGDLLS
ncbi:alkylmercury lyase-like protein [Herbihabitans rhizosphaerae]|uniref:Alkylmercury lyase-like protein n=2 Tax=Herbihabitans rhizosphaerae TaxID=1872711 RepID=A0A4Q7L415_9PSEU|nr:alkylmercury lyase-like protein [Herbihabitans rhizosphaerae]